MELDRDLIERNMDKIMTIMESRRPITKKRRGEVIRLALRVGQHISFDLDEDI